MIATWRTLRPLLPRRTRARLTVLAIISFVSGLLEAAVLVLVVHAGLELTETTDTSLDLPIVGELGLSTGSTLTLAGVLATSALVAHMATAWLAARLTADTLVSVRDACVDAFSGASWERQSTEREGAFQENTSSLSRNTASLVSSASRLISATLALVAMLGGALLIDWVAALAMIVFGGAMALGFRPFNAMTKGRSRAFVRANLDFMESTAQWSRMARELRVFGVVESEATRLKSQSARAGRLMARSKFLANFASSLYRDAAVLVLIGGIAILAAISDRNLAALGASVLVVLRSISYSQQIVSTLNTIVEQSPNLELLTARLASLTGAHPNPGTTRIEAIHEVVFDDVGYDYGDGEVALRGVSFTIEAGETVGVIGPSGAGKTTLAELLLGLRPPTSGMIRIDGTPSTEVTAQSWASLVALVPQQPHLFEGTIADNIRLLRAGHCDEAVRSAARRAHLLAEIEQMPRGMDTPLGPQGSGLSGGQRQRLAIARALLGQPELIVLDEPTSALDVVSESLLVDTLRELHGDVTFVIIAHRIETLQTCDRVLAIADGHLLVDGAIDEALRAVSFDDN